MLIKLEVTSSTLAARSTLKQRETAPIKRLRAVFLLLCFAEFAENLSKSKQKTVENCRHCRHFLSYEIGKGIQTQTQEQTV